ncbi:hypothetical protein KJ765_06775 [Candidatus Micrarchaeota archaeon]|nr:hypothetical protein [Candidatus Micrarchaeota archaeon]
MSLERVWKQRLTQSVDPCLKRLRKRHAFAGFVTNVDNVCYCQPENLEPLFSQANMEKVNQLKRRADQLEIRGLEEFLAGYLFCFGNGKALELPFFDPAFGEWLDKTFQVEEARMGGQAGIIANQIAELGGHVVCYCTLLSPVQAKLFHPQRVSFPIERNGKLQLLQPIQAANISDRTKINWIFEFHKGDVIHVNGKKIAAPRDNRFIVLSKLIKTQPLFPPSLDAHLPELAQHFDRAMIAGFHHLHASEKGKGYSFYLDVLCKQLERIKTANPSLKLHVEYVMIHDPGLEKEVYERVGYYADSLGINEVETPHLLERLGYTHLARNIRTQDNAIHLYEGAVKLCEKYEFERVHIHSLGFFLLLLHKKACDASRLKDYRHSLLFASLTAEARAALGKPPTPADIKKRNPGVSPIGMQQMRLFAAEAKKRYPDFNENQFLEEGTAEFGQHFLIMVPTAVAQKPKSTVGLGDTISSSALLSEP